MNLFRSMSKKRALPIMAIVAMALVACEAGPFCNDPNDPNRPEDIINFKSADEAQGRTSTPAPTSVSTATASATAVATGSAPPSATATAGAGATQAVRLRAAFGVDHPTFVKDYGVGGKSVGLACVSGIPLGGTVTIQITGGTGAPPSILGGGGADGTVVIPFPIQQFGMMNGTITGLRINGQPANFQADPFSYTVDASDLICTPPR